jgi:hypothetical protein
VFITRILEKIATRIAATVAVYAAIRVVFVAEVVLRDVVISVHVQQCLL